MDWLLAYPIMTPAAIRGRFELDVLKDFGSPKLAVPSATHLEVPAAGAPMWKEKLFERSLPARIVLNGALMLLYEALGGESHSHWEPLARATEGSR
jgi:hypothetical protein